MSDTNSIYLNLASEKYAKTIPPIVILEYSRIHDCMDAGGRATQEAKAESIKRVHFADTFLLDAGILQHDNIFNSVSINHV